MTIISTVDMMYIKHKRDKGKRDILWWFRQRDSNAIKKKRKNKKQKRESATNKILSQRNSKIQRIKICIQILEKCKLDIELAILCKTFANFYLDFTWNVKKRLFIKSCIILSNCLLFVYYNDYLSRETFNEYVPLR